MKKPQLTPLTDLGQAPSSTEYGAALELAGAGMLWGFGFIATVWVLEAMGPLYLTGLRFVLAGLIGFILVLPFAVLRKQVDLDVIKLTFVPGLMIGVAMVLQTWGMKYTTATKSSFITTLYVLIVPLIERFWLGRTLQRMHFVYVIFALVGVALICDLPGEFRDSDPNMSASLRWNLGDFLTLLCAVAAGVHIVYLGLIRNRIRSSFVFNAFQSFWAGAPVLLLALVFEAKPQLGIDKPFLGLSLLVFCSTLIAFSLQIRAQKKISPSLASLLFLLESPFATLFAIYFLNESLRAEQWVGAGIILLAAGLSTAFTTEVKAEAIEATTERQG